MIDFWVVLDNLIAILIATTPLDCAIFIFVRRTRAAVARANRLSNLMPELTAEEEDALRDLIRRTLAREVTLYRQRKELGI